MKHGDLALYVQEIEKNASISKAIGGVLKNVKRSLAATKSSPMMHRVSKAGGAAIRGTKREWAALPSSSKMKVGIAGGFAGGVAASKIL